jgi:hypothetical protein
MLAVSLAESTPQILVLSVIIEGAEGFPPISTLIILDAKLIPQEFLHFAV